MSTQAHAIYQSGEQVTVSGMYEVVGNKRTTKTTTGEFALRELHVGEVFPNYEGRSVAWHPVRMPDEQAARIATPKPIEFLHNKNDLFIG